MNTHLDSAINWVNKYVGWMTSSVNIIVVIYSHLISYNILTGRVAGNRFSTLFNYNKELIRIRLLIRGLTIT